MKRAFPLFAAAVLCVVVAALCSAFPSSTAAAGSGEALFKEHCAVCHPDGGNIVNPKKTLHKKDREANNISTEADIVKLMRKPGPGMLAFDVKTLSDHDALSIAEYVLKTFNK